MKALQLDAKEAISKNIKKIIAEKGMTQSQLATKSGISQSALSQVLTGSRWPDYSTIVSICDALKCEHTEITSHPDLLDAFKKLKSLK